MKLIYNMLQYDIKSMISIKNDKNIEKGNEKHLLLSFDKILFKNIYKKC